jgi:hypothetical protein
VKFIKDFKRSLVKMFIQGELHYTGMYISKAVANKYDLDVVGHYVSPPTACRNYGTHYALRNHRYIAITVIQPTKSTVSLFTKP